MATSRAQRRSTVLQSPTSPVLPTPAAESTTATHTEIALLPLGALMLAASMGAMAQTGTAETTLSTVTVKETAEVQGKDTLLIKKTTVGKGKQDIKDIPQSVTVFTEKLMSDRNQDDFREVLRTTAGVTFLAGETGEEDVRLRGFSLGQAGDIYIDGMKDAPLIDPGHLVLRQPALRRLQRPHAGLPDAPAAALAAVRRLPDGRPQLRDVHQALPPAAAEPS